MENHTNLTRVKIVDIDVPMDALFVLSPKLAIVAIPVAIVLAVVFLAVTALLGGPFGHLAR